MQQTGPSIDLTTTPEMEPIEAVPYQNVPTPSVPPEPVAEQRAVKSAIGIPGWMDKDKVKGEILNGREGPARDNAAAHVSAQNTRVRNDLITRLVAQRQGQGGWAPTEEEKNVVDELLRQNTDADPKTVFEENYAKKYFENISHQASRDPDSQWHDGDPTHRAAAQQRGSEIVARDEILNTIYDEAYTQAQNQGWPGWLADRAKEWLIPGYDLYKGQAGEQLRNESIKLYSMPLDQFKFEVGTRAAELMKNNPLQALHWLAAMRGLSNSEQAAANLFAGIGAIPVVGAGTAARIALRGTEAAKDALYLRNVVKTARDVNLTEAASPAAMHEAAGAIKEAGAVDAAKQITANVAGKTTSKDILDNLPSLFQSSIDALKGSPGSLRREGVERIMQAYESAKLAVINAAANSIKVDRMPVIAAVQKAARELGEAEASRYPEIHNTLLNAAIRPEPAINGHYVDFFLGKTGDSLFSTEKIANNFVKNNKLLDATVEQAGTGFYIKISKPLPETGYARNMLLHTQNVHTPNSWLNSLVGRFRSPEDTLSLAQREARKAATYGPSAYEHMAKKVTEEVTKLGSWTNRLVFPARHKKWQDFQTVIQSIEREPKWFDTVGDVEQLYQKSIHRLPDEQEIAAAFAWKRGEELYQTWRDLQAYKNLHRLGAQTHVISIPSIETKESFRGFKDHKFIGKRITLDELRDDTVMVLGKTSGKEEFKTSRSIRNDWELAQKIKRGEASIYQVFNHGDQPLNDMSKMTRGQFPRYVVDPDGGRISSKQLEWNQYGRRPPTYDYDHYIKQPIVKFDPVSNRHLYLGDKTIAVHNIRAMSVDVAAKLDKIREFLAAKDGLGAQRFHASSGLEHPYAEVRGWFEKGLPVKGANGKFTPGAPARLSLSEPIRSVPRNKMTIETHKDLDKYKKTGGGLNDIAHEGSGRYLGEHYDPQDVFTYRNDGTAQNPLYKIAPVNWINPIETLNRSLRRIASSQFMDDYKAFSVEHWIQEAAPYLNATKAEIERAPHWYFHNADSMWKTAVGDDLFRQRNLNTARRQIQQFIGEPDSTSAWLHSIAQKLSDSIYTKGSAKIALAAESLLPRLRDPYTFLRSMTFHSKLGLFNVPQLIVQAQTYANIWAIAPKYAAAGTRAAFLYGWTQVNRHPEILNALDKMMTKGTGGIGSWKPGEWLEATKFLENSGFLHVAGEQALRDTLSKNNVISNGKQTFLDWGAVFFNKGEKSVRLGAGYTAYKEFRATKPTGALSNADKLKIMNRADDLYVNMSRASSSQLQRGVWSIPSQFMGYQLRLTEQFLSKRLTVAEKARLFGVYAGLYGVPGAVGLTGLTSGDFMRKWAYEDGYTVGQNWVTTAITEGAPSLISGLVSGNYYGFQSRYGSQGVTPIKDLLTGDKTFWDVFTGATGGSLHNLFGTGGINGNLGSMHGFFKAVHSLISMDDQFPFQIEDFVEPFKEISSVNTTWKTIMALNTGNMVSKREAVVSEVSPVNAIFQALTGLQDQRVIDNYLKLNIRKEEEAFQKYTLSKFTEDVRRAIVANKNGDPEQAKAFLRRARAWLDSSDYPEHQKGSAWSIALQGYESMIDKGDWDWAFGDKTPPSRQKQSIDQYMSIKQQQANP